MAIAEQELPETSFDPLGQYFLEIGSTPLLSREEETTLSRTFLQGQGASELLAQNPNLTVEEIEQLQGQITRGSEAQQSLIKANLKLVISIAKHYPNCGTLSFLDLIQEGNLGLMKAIEHFDPDKGFKISTYAVWWIRQAIERGIADTSQTLRIPVYVQENARKLYKFQLRFLNMHGREPTIEELCQELPNFSPDKIEKILEAQKLQPCSLEETIFSSKDDDIPLKDSLVDPSLDARPEDLACLRDQKRTLLQYLKGYLSKRERQIIILRFGLDDGRPKTLEEVGKQLYVTRERIRQIEVKALKKLSSSRRKEKLADYLK